MAIYRLGEQEPRIAATAYISEHAVVIGDVVLEDGASVWPGAVIRADNCRIVIGAGSNIQEGAVLHSDPDMPLTVGAHVTVGHQAMLHGCTIGMGCLIGIQAVVLNEAVVGEHSLVGAGTLVPERRVYPPGKLLLGSPARVLRELDHESQQKLIKTAQGYEARARHFRESLVRIG